MHYHSRYDQFKGGYHSVRIIGYINHKQYFLHNIFKILPKLKLSRTLQKYQKRIEKKTGEKCNFFLLSSLFCTFFYNYLKSNLFLADFPYNNISRKSEKNLITGPYSIGVKVFRVDISNGHVI